MSLRKGFPLSPHFLCIDSSLLGTSASKHRIDPSLLFLRLQTKNSFPFQQSKRGKILPFTLSAETKPTFFGGALSRQRRGGKRVVQIRFLALLFSVSSPKKLPESLDSTPPLCMCEARASSTTAFKKSVITRPQTRRRPFLLKTPIYTELPSCHCQSKSKPFFSLSSFFLASQPRKRDFAAHPISLARGPASPRPIFTQFHFFSPRSFQHKK